MAKKFKFRYVNEIVGGFVLLTFVLLLAGADELVTAVIGACRQRFQCPSVATR